MYGIRISFDEEVWKAEKLVKIDLASLLATIIPITMEFQVSYTLPYGCLIRRITIDMKWSWEFLTRVKQTLFPWVKDFEMTYQTYEVCEENGCHQEVAAITFILGTDDVFLWDFSGEEVSRLHTNCRSHCPAPVLHQGNTLLITNLTVGQEYWEKILSWKIRTRYYSQRVEKGRDGEYETGYYDIQTASPYLGPFATRGEAIAGAIDYDVL